MALDRASGDAHGRGHLFNGQSGDIMEGSGRALAAGKPAQRVLELDLGRPGGAVSVHGSGHPL
jgi:hypothetical protein